VTTERTVLQERLIAIIKRFPKRRLLVVGDAIADQFVYGGITRVSREAPVFIIRHEHTETVPGGAANCAVNIASLGAQVSLASVAGADEAGKTLVQKLDAAGVDCQNVITSVEAKTTTKVRILAGQSHSTRQQVVRIDYDGESTVNKEVRERLLEVVREQASTTDAIIISDYNYGIVDEELAGFIRHVAAARKTPVLVDSRFRLLSFADFTSATPNEAEVEQLLARELKSTEDLIEAGEELSGKLNCRSLLVTRGGQGMLLLEAGAPPLLLDAVGGHEPVDVTGAGDTVIATYALALSSDASFSDAARLANYAGGLVVMKRGTASVTAGELENSVLHTEV
jgi:rfaE bifunctional protein kinase chain/domain